jgi:imidazolonepropionase-like amidohydrolase
MFDGISSGCTVLPGLIDCHVHLALDGRDFASSVRRWEDPAACLAMIESQLADTLAAGVVAVRDGGDRHLLTCHAAGTVRRLPEVTPTGHALRVKGKYGSFLGPGLDSASLPSAVADLAAKGIRQVKVLTSGIVGFKEYGQVGPQQFDRRGLEAICQAARGLGLRVMAHASSDEAVRAAVLAGADSIEHGYFLTKETLALMAGKNVAWVPTIVPVAVRLTGSFRQSHSPEELVIIERVVRRQQEMATQACELGVRVGAGTDAGAAGVRHGLSFVDELKLLLAGGLPISQVIRAATANAAAITGTSGAPGVIAPGREANLIAVRGDLVGNIDLLRKPAFLFSRLP